MKAKSWRLSTRRVSAGANPMRSMRPFFGGGRPWSGSSRRTPSRVSRSACAAASSLRHQRGSLRIGRHLASDIIKAGLLVNETISITYYTVIFDPRLGSATRTPRRVCEIAGPCFLPSQSAARPSCRQPVPHRGPFPVTAQRQLPTVPHVGGSPRTTLSTHAAIALCVSAVSDPGAKAKRPGAETPATQKRTHSETLR
ncbi:hypothetical protein SAMN05444166_1752 [Singulisphaera sp. GP187]|nr:hypothetical protein SAMN05444166_1752 [Singulisphaera sp. GP187]